MEENWQCLKVSSQEKILQILSEDMYPFQRPQKIPDRDKINILKMFKEIKETIISMKKD